MGHCSYHRSISTLMPCIIGACLLASPGCGVDINGAGGPGNSDAPAEHVADGVPEEQDGPCELLCHASCESMGWDLSCESGPASGLVQEFTTFQYYPGTNLVECTVTEKWGTWTYANSGNSYDYEETYDWCDCSLSVNVNGVGECGDE